MPEEIDWMEVRKELRKGNRSIIGWAKYLLPIVKRELTKGKAMWQIRTELWMLAI